MKKSNRNIKNDVPSRTRRIQRSLDALESGKYAEFDIHQCCDYIFWLQKWNKAPREIWEPMCEQATRILENS